MKLTSFFWGALIGLVGCGPVDPIATHEDMSMDDAVSVSGDVILDERVSYLQHDPVFIDFYTPDVIIYPGEDKNLCVHVSFDGDDTGISALEVLQGKFGHHLLLMTTSRPQPPGTLEDCDDPDVLRTLRPVMYPNLPLSGEGGVRAIGLTKGMPLVLHFHHINTRTVPVLVRDRARLKKIDPREVTHWVSAMALASFDFELGRFSETTVTFDCSVPRDLDLLLIGGHMHELGKRFSIFNLNPLVPDPGSGEEESRVYSVDGWQPYFRDAPPIKPLWGQPRRLLGSSLMRVYCTWYNHTEWPVTFPTEMCAVFGYVQEVMPATPPGVVPKQERYYCDAKSTVVEGTPQ